MDVDIIGVDIDRIADIIGAEGGDLECFPSSRSFSVQVPLSTGFTQLVRLSIVTATGQTITKTLVLSLDTLGEPDSTTILQMSGTVSILQPTGSEGDDH